MLQVGASGIEEEEEEEEEEDYTSESPKTYLQINLSQSYLLPLSLTPF
jgi:hypothetical protein